MHYIFCLLSLFIILFIITNSIGLYSLYKTQPTNEHYSQHPSAPLTPLSSPVLWSSPLLPLPSPPPSPSPRMLPGRTSLSTSPTSPPTAHSHALQEKCTATQQNLQRSGIKTGTEIGRIKTEILTGRQIRQHRSAQESPGIFPGKFSEFSWGAGGVHYTIFILSVPSGGGVGRKGWWGEESKRRREGHGECKGGGKVQIHYWWVLRRHAARLA